MKGEGKDWTRCGLSNLHGKDEWCGRAARWSVVMEDDFGNVTNVCPEHLKRIKAGDYRKKPLSIVALEPK